MTIDNTPLDFEVKRVFESNFEPNFYSYIVQFKIGDQIIETIKVLSIDEMCDYELAYGAVKMVSLVMPLGDYVTYIYPNREKLEVILKTETINYASQSGTNQQDSIEVEVFNISLDPTARPFMSEDNNSESLDRETMNLIDLVEVDFQLKPKLLDDISKTLCGGQYIEMTTSEVIRNAISMHCAQLEVDDEEKLLGVDVHPTASEDIRQQVILPHGLPLTDLPDYIQTKAGGVFPTGMAHFIHERHWFVYPPYDTTGYDEAVDKLVIISVPAKRYPHVEKTYVTSHGITTILSTGNKRINSDKKQIQDNSGNGVIFADANQIVEGFAEARGNEAIARRSTTNNEFVGQESPTGKNNVRMSPEGITANPYVASSRIARGQGHFFTVEWENADPKIIKPGLNIKILYLDEGEVKEVNGVLLKSHAFTNLNGKGLMANGYRTFIAMVIFVRQQDADATSLAGFS